MAIFSIICLIIILISSQHILNYLLRQIWKEDFDDKFTLISIAILVFGLITFISIYYIIYWGNFLI